MINEKNNKSEGKQALELLKEISESLKGIRNAMDEPLTSPKDFSNLIETMDSVLFAKRSKPLTVTVKQLDAIALKSKIANQMKPWTSNTYCNALKFVGRAVFECERGHIVYTIIPPFTKE